MKLQEKLLAIEMLTVLPSRVSRKGCLQESLERDPQELSEGESNDRSEERGCDEKHKYVPEEH